MLIKRGVQGTNFYKDEDIERFRYNPYRIKNRHLAEKAFAENKHLPFPLHVIIEISSLCNMKCSFCNREVMSRPQVNMDLEVFRRVVDECAENGVYSLSLYCLGEPFLNPDLREMIVYAKGRGIPYVDVSTNGLLPMNGILGTELNELIISIDGFEKTYHALRGGGNWLQVVSNAERLRKERDRLRLKNPIIRVQCIDMWETREEVKPKEGKESTEFIDWAFSIGDVVYIKNIEAFSQNLGDRNLPQSDIVGRLATRKPCKQMYFCLTVNADGNIEACCHSPFGYSKLGNINEMTLKKAWDSIKEPRERHRQGDYSDFQGMCIQCTDYSW